MFRVMAQVGHDRSVSHLRHDAEQRTRSLRPSVTWRARSSFGVLISRGLDPVSLLPISMGDMVYLSRV